jgi:hypothetical protein
MAMVVRQNGRIEPRKVYFAVSVKTMQSSSHSESRILSLEGGWEVRKGKGVEEVDKSSTLPKFLSGLGQHT